MPRLAAILAAAVASLLAVPAHADSPAATPAYAAPPVAVVVAPEPERTQAIYYTESIGGFSLRDELASQIGASGGLAIRLALGYRAGRLAVEGWVSPLLDTDSTDGTDPEMLTYGVAGKYLFPVSRHLHVYVRGELGKMTLRPYEGWADANTELEYSGRGLGLGSGVTLSGRVSALGLLFAPLFLADIGPKVDAAISLDQGYDFYRVRPGPGRTSYDAQVTSWMIGFSLGHSW